VTAVHHLRHQFSAEALWLTGIFKKSHYRIPPPQIPVFLIRQT
jgi:hypothetical protein